MRERLLAGTHPDVAMSRVALGNLLVDQSRFDEGCALGAGAPDLLSEPLGEDMYETTDRPAEAARYRRMLDEASLESPR